MTLTQLGAFVLVARLGSVRGIWFATPDAMQLMCAPGTGVPPSRFRPRST